MTNQTPEGNSDLIVDCTAYSAESSEIYSIDDKPRPFIRFDKLKFDKKYNIVYAPNGSGKTTFVGRFVDGNGSVNIKDQNGATLINTYIGFEPHDNENIDSSNTLSLLPHIIMMHTKICVLNLDYRLL